MNRGIVFYVSQGGIWLGNSNLANLNLQEDKATESVYLRCVVKYYAMHNVLYISSWRGLAVLLILVEGQCESLSSG